MIWMILLAAVLNMAIGFVWYTPKTFGTMWMKDVHIDFSKTDKTSMIKAMVASFIGYMLVAFVLVTLKEGMGIATMGNMLELTLWVWLAFVLGVRLSHALFEQKSLRYVAITAGHDLAGMIVTAVVMFYA